MTDELVMRLRYLSPLGRKAADAIERITRERDEARSRFNDLDLCRHAQAPCDNLLRAHERMAKLEAAIENLRQREVQALHAGLSRRDWHETETAANQLRNRIDDALADRRREAARAASEATT